MGKRYPFNGCETGVLGALVAEPVQEQATIAAEVEEVFDKLPESKPEPVKNEDVKLRIHSMSGKYGLYTRKGNAICIDPTPAYVATADDVDAICAEIKAAFEMMA